MISIGSWNIWGLNNLQTQKAVQEWTNKNNLEQYQGMVPKLVHKLHWQWLINITLV
jgi:hypothetical protein